MISFWIITQSTLHLKRDDLKKSPFVIALKGIFRTVLLQKKFCALNWGVVNDNITF
jgi:hypothetical protein